jgi:hypothetical protein
MRDRKEIEQDHKPYEGLVLEVLLDIRDLSMGKMPEESVAPLYVSDKPTKPAKKRMGRPKGSRNKKKE